MLNKRPYTNNIAVFDMFTVILPNKLESAVLRSHVVCLSVSVTWSIVITYVGNFGN